MYVYVRVFHENMFSKKKMAQPALQVFGGYFEGIQKVSVRKSEGRVNIYNVKMVNTEMACAPLKLVEIKNPFGFLQSSPQILAERVAPFFGKHPTAHSQQVMSSLPGPPL